MIAGRYDLERLDPPAIPRTCLPPIAIRTGSGTICPMVPLPTLQPIAPGKEAMAAKSDPFSMRCATLPAGGWAALPRSCGLIRRRRDRDRPYRDRTADAAHAGGDRGDLADDRLGLRGHRRVEWKCNALNEPSRIAALRYGFAFGAPFAST